MLVARDQGELQKLTDSLKDMHPGIAVSFMRYDLSKMHDIRELENRIAGMSDLDILVNCAGFGINKEFVDENIEKREDMVMVHDIAAMRLTYEAIGAMKKR